MSKRDLISAHDLTTGELDELLELAAKMKKHPPGPLLAGKSLGLVFFDRSLRTRVSFDVAMMQLGGHSVNMFADRDIYDLEPIDRAVMDGAAEEHVKDAARTLSRYVDALGVRHVPHHDSWEVARQEAVLRAYAEFASVPVINLESVREHPCQAIADSLTIREHVGNTKGRKLTLAWTYSPEAKSPGVTHSVLTCAASMGLDITVAHPLGFELDGEIMDTARGRTAQSGGSIRVVNDLSEGCRGAEVLYARSWGSLKLWGEPEREEVLKRSLDSWRVDGSTMELTDSAIFMHPLPVRRNVVATDDVLDSPRSVIYDQAENRLHVGKALLAFLLG